MVNTAPIFDRELLQKRRKRASHNFAEYEFLHQRAAAVLEDRLLDVTRDFDQGLAIGAALSDLPKIATLEHTQDNVTGPEERFAYAENSLDVIVSNLMLHTINDLPGALVQMRSALRPDGLFVAAMFGGETLYELREVMAHTELSLRGGQSPRISPFADKQQMGSLMQRAGFALPVVDSDIFTVTYSALTKLLHDLRGMGESNIIAARDKRYVGRDFFPAVERAYQESYAEVDGRLPASFEIIYLTGWAPHASQQKPLRPGSAENRLADALDTDEIEVPQ